ncbi:MAG: sensory rhodopsin transducer [Armatimonadetes bacterium]|nr:sensory rhodopsin transducer [Armatimonadota bacterium]
MRTVSAGEGRKTWIFPDGDLPPPGEPGLPLEGHESLIVLNTGDEEAALEIDVYFGNREPETGLQVSVPGRRVSCFRLDKPLGDRRFQIPYGQYALRLRSSVPVVAQIGRADVRQPNLAYYTTPGFSID